MKNTSLTLGAMICLLIAATSNAFTQGEYCKRGISGFEGDLGFCSNKETNGYQLSMGYSFHGILDAGFSWTKGQAGMFGDGIFSPEITYYLLKQEDGKRVPTLGISLSYSHYSLDESETFYFHADSVSAKINDTTLVSNTTFNFITIMGTAHRYIGRWKKFDFEAFVGAGFAVSDQSWRFVWRAGLSIMTLPQKKARLIIKPVIQREPDLTTFILSIGILV